MDKILHKADVALPDATTTYISLPTEKEGVFQIYRKFPQNTEDYDNAVYLDQYSGKVLKVSQSSDPKSLTERFTSSFSPVHFGTFWGVPSRIFYVFIGLTPLILSITGFAMWRYRYQGKTQIKREPRTYPSLRKFFASIKEPLTQKQARSRRNP